jgi:hypothetical protein
MDTVKQAFNDLVVGYPQGTSEGQFIQGWARAIRAETGRDIPLEKLAKLYHDYAERSEEIMQSHGTTNEESGAAADTYKDTSGTFKDRLVGEILNFYSMHGRIPRISEYSRAVRSKLNSLDFDERSKLHRQANVRALKLAGKQGNLSKLGLDEGEDDLYEPGVAEGMQTYRDYVKPDDLDVQKMAKMAAKGLLDYAVKRKMNPANLLKKDYYALAEMLEKVNPNLYAAIDDQLSDNDYNWVYFKAASLAANTAAKQDVAEESKGLWANIHAKQNRIKNGSGEHMRKPGSKGAPTNANFKSASKTESVEETTGDPKFDKMLKDITGKKVVAKQQKADTKQQSRDAFSSMFGGGNPTDTLSIRKKGVAEGLDEAVGGNYLYHATGSNINDLKNIISNGLITNASNQERTGSKLRALSFTRNWRYALTTKDDDNQETTGIANGVIFVVDQSILKQKNKMQSVDRPADIINEFKAVLAALPTAESAMDLFQLIDGSVTPAQLAALSQIAGSSTPIMNGRQFISAVAKPYLADKTNQQALANAQSKIKQAISYFVKTSAGKSIASAGGSTASEYEEVILTPLNYVPFKDLGVVGYMINPEVDSANQQAIRNLFAKVGVNEMPIPNSTRPGTGVAEAGHGDANRLEHRGAEYNVYFNTGKGMYTARGKGQMSGQIQPEWFYTLADAQDHAEMEIGGYDEHDGVSEATGDTSFDSMMGNIVKGARYKGAAADQRADAAYGGMMNNITKNAADVAKPSADSKFEQVYSAVERILLSNNVHWDIDDDISDALAKLKIKATDKLIQKLERELINRVSDALQFYDDSDLEEQSMTESTGYKSQFPSAAPAIQYAKDKVKTFRDPDDGIEIWSMPDGGCDVVHTSNSNGRNHCIDNRGKKLGTIRPQKQGNK